jgi:alpha-galactosidase
LALVACGRDDPRVAGTSVAPSEARPEMADDGSPAEDPSPAQPLIAQTPPMGFNDWNAFGCNVSEALIKETADFLVSRCRGSGRPRWE